MIKLVVFDIDGVLTDGTLTVNSLGQEQKRINIKDIDAIFELHKKGFKLAAITGEKTEIVSYFRNRFPWDNFYGGCKHKLATLETLCKEMDISLEQTAYIGDGKYDLEVMPHVGISVCPADAIREAKLKADFVLQKNGGDGCVWELLSVLESVNSLDNPVNYFNARMAEHQLIFKRISTDRTLVVSVMQLGKTMAERLKAAGRVFFCGNGGSAADAQHIAAEFVGRFYKERPALWAEALTTNTSILTAIGNDYGYERVFVRQLEAKAKQEDILVGISTSGSSNNVLEALRYGKAHGMLTVMLTGEYYPLELDSLCDYVIRIPSVITPRIQEAHIFIGHLLAEYVEYSLFGGK